MPNAINLALLNRADRLIASEQLHAGDVRDPVAPTALLKHVTYWYGLVSNSVLASTSQWRCRPDRFADIAFNVLLAEPEWSPYNRHAIAHEFAHIFCRHRGDLFILWRNGYGPDPFERFIDDTQERQCEYMASYFLIQRRALLDLHNASNQEIAQIVDVPERLVPLRWYIWDRFQR